MTTHIAPIPMATPATIGSPGRCESAIPPAAPRNIAGNTGTAAEGAERQAVRDALAHDEHQQGADRVPVAVLSSGPTASWPENSTSVKLRPVPAS